MRSTLLFVSSAVLVFSGVGAASTCRKYEDGLPDGSLGFCAGIVNYTYYVEDDTVDQGKLELKAFGLVKNPQAFSPIQQVKQGGEQAIEALLSLVGDRCQASLKKAACLVAFPPCTSLDPFFVNKCSTSCSANGFCDGGNSIKCSPKPGIQVGTSAAAWDAGSCKNATGDFAFVNNKCVKQLPKYPCKADHCDNLITMDKSKRNTGPLIREFSKADCPLISGKFASSLFTVRGLRGGDAAIRSEIDAVLASKNCASPAECAAVPLTVNLLLVSHAAPDCIRTVNFDGTALAVFPDVEQVNLKTIVEKNIAAIAQDGKCGVEADGATTISCADVRRSYACTAKDESGAASIQASLDVADEDHVCLKELESPANADERLINTLNIREGNAQDVESVGIKCSGSGKFKGAYFVPPALGMAPLAPRIDTGRKTIVHKDRFKEVCPKNAFDINKPSYATLIGSQHLCESKVLDSRGNRRLGFNARDCQKIKVEDSSKLFPRFATPQCRGAFMEMLCAQTHMKMELKLVCLNSEGSGCQRIPADGGDTDTVPFTFVVPKFPSKSLCRKYKEQCADLIKIDVAKSKASNTTSQLDINCDAKVEDFLTGCDNKVFANSIWGCKSSLGSLPAFVEETQDFGSARALFLLNQLTGNTVTAEQVAKEFISNGSLPTLTAPLYVPREEDQGLTDVERKDLQVQYCQCPAPLVSPDDINFVDIIKIPGDSARGIPDLSTCCALPCTRTMISATELNSLSIFQLILSFIGTVLALFMVLTWGIFKSKAKQYVTFWFSFCSLICSLVLLFGWLSVSGNLQELNCKDNTTPHSMKNSGLTVCTVQSFVLLFFSLAECMWWVIQAVDLFRKIVMRKKDTERSKLLYHIVAWTCPTFAVLGMLLKQRAGFGAPTPFCFFSADTPAIGQYLIYFFFVMLCFVLGVALMIAVILTIKKHTANVAKAQGSTKGQRLKLKYNLYRTPIVFVFVFVAIWVVIFSYRLSATLNEEVYLVQAKSWISCLLNNFKEGMDNPARDPRANTAGLVGASSSQEGCGITQPGGIPFAMTFAMFLAASSQSIFVFFIFGLKAENFLLWKQKFGCAAGSDDKTLESLSSFSKGSKTDVAGGSYHGGSYHGSYHGKVGSYHESQGQSLSQAQFGVGAPPFQSFSSGQSGDGPGYSSSSPAPPSPRGNLAMFPNQKTLPKTPLSPGSSFGQRVSARMQNFSLFGQGNRGPPPPPGLD